MIRQPLRPEEHERGRALGRTLRAARGARSLPDVAAEAGISPETLRKIETGRIATPAFFTIMALCGVLGVTADQLAEDIERGTPGRVTT
ncbi:helix-turn-helix transcriptional regulator [Glycomyces sp. NPDC021274]|uniref:helix-turn-helix domain-containing protein n=1 Tax=Glycomyces sp. NPDC021274 TaxID=3155120 RepID=UPI0033CBDDE3